MRTGQKAKCSKSSRQDEFLICLLYAWQAGKAPAAREALLRYCEYICFHGYPGFASDVIDALEGMDKWSAEAWIRQTQAQYVQDNRVMLQYIFGLKIKKEK